MESLWVYRCLRHGGFPWGFMVIDFDSGIDDFDSGDIQFASGAFVIRFPGRTF